MEVVRRERKSCDLRVDKNRTTKVLRVEGDVRCTELADLVNHRSKERKVGCTKPGPRHLSLGQPIRFTSGETSDHFAVCRRKGQ